MAESMGGQGFRSVQAMFWNYKRVVVANPAPATDWQVVVPQGALWELVYAQTLLNTSATATNRVMLLEVDAELGGNSVYQCPPVNLQGASLSWIYRWAPTGTSFIPVGIPTNQSMSIAPKLCLQAGGVIRTRCTNMQAGDQQSAVIFTVKEYHPSIKLSFT